MEFRSELTIGVLIAHRREGRGEIVPDWGISSPPGETLLPWGKWCGEMSTARSENQIPSESTMVMRMNKRIWNIKSIGIEMINIPIETIDIQNMIGIIMIMSTGIDMVMKTIGMKMIWININVLVIIKMRIIPPLPYRTEGKRKKEIKAFPQKFLSIFIYTTICAALKPHR